MKALSIMDNDEFTKNCNVTFIIGNGFDLGLGMKTKYTDVYDGYIYSPSKSQVISDFKTELQSHNSDNYKNWSDFEMAMAEYARRLTSEDELIECVRDFKGFMVNHLKQENNRMLELINDKGYLNNLVKEFERSLDLFYIGLTRNDINSIKNLLNNANIERQYVSFNYTSTFEAFLILRFKSQKILENTPIHIHGDLNNDVVLGIDNIEQLKYTPYLLTRKGKRAFVKTIFNEQYDKTRVETAEKIISQSNIICVYGFSMGESDKTWTDLLANWLIENPEHHLVVYQYDETEYNYYNRDEIMDVEDEKKELLLKKLRIDNEQILNQIHIPIGEKLFNFSFTKIERPLELSVL